MIGDGVVWFDIRKTKQSEEYVIYHVIVLKFLKVQIIPQNHFIVAGKVCAALSCDARKLVETSGSEVVSKLDEFSIELMIQGFWYQSLATLR